MVVPMEPRSLVGVLLEDEKAEAARGGDEGETDHNSGAKRQREESEPTSPKRQATATNTTVPEQDAATELGLMVDSMSNAEFDQLLDEILDVVA